MRLRVGIGLVALGVLGAVAAAVGCAQQTFVSPERPDLYKPAHEYDLAVPLAETGEDLAVGGSHDLTQGATDLAKAD